MTDIQQGEGTIKPKIGLIYENGSVSSSITSVYDDDIYEVYIGIDGKLEKYNLVDYRQDEYYRLLRDRVWCGGAENERDHIKVVNTLVQTISDPIARAAIAHNLLRCCTFENVKLSIVFNLARIGDKTFFHAYDLVGFCENNEVKYFVFDSCCPLIVNNVAYEPLVHELTMEEYESIKNENKSDLAFVVHHDVALSMPEYDITYNTSIQKEYREPTTISGSGFRKR